MKRLITTLAVAVLAVLAFTPIASAAGTTDCASSYMGGGPPWILAWNQSVRSVSCATAHRVIAHGYVGRSWSLVYGETMSNPPGWSCAPLGWWVPNPRGGLDSITGAVVRCTQGARAFRFSDGHRSRLWVSS